MHGNARLAKRVSMTAVAVIVAGVAAVSTGVGVAFAQVPTAVTSAATSVSGTTATLNGTVNPNGDATTYSFEYGTTTAYGLTTPAVGAGSGVAAIAASAAVTGLLPNTTYYFQLMATNANGTQLGGQLTFFTSGTTTVTVNRVSGDERYQTSAAIAEAKYPGGVPGGAVVLATGTDFPDALAGNYLAGQLGAPILLTPASASDPAFNTTLAALSALNASSVYILGGTSAVGADVEAALAAHYTVTRIAGPTRYDTMQLADTQPGMTPSAGVSGGLTAVIATGENFPDALAAGPLAWADKFPIILTDGTQTTLSPQAVAVITALGITHFIVVGGPSSINPAQVTQLSAYGTVDAQFSGVDRTDTAAQFAAYTQSTYAFGKTSVILATGADYPDALSAGAWGGDTQNIYLTETADVLGTPTTDAFTALAGTTSELNIAGGLTAVDQNAETAAQTALGGGSGTLAPTAVTESASAITGTTATLNGLVDPNGSVTTYTFEYGTSTSLGLSSVSQTTLATSGSQSVSVSIGGLSTGTPYYYELVATNANGTTDGQMLSFTAGSGIGPAVSGVSPNAGPIAGGQIVTVSGTNLSGATAVAFGANQATIGSVAAGGNSMTVTVPGGAVGVVDVIVTTPSGSSTATVADEYTYEPTMASAVVTSGTYSGSGSTGTVSVTFTSPVTCPAAGQYSYTNGGSTVTFATCTGSAPSTTWTLAPAPGTVLNAPSSDTVSYTQAGSPSTSNATYATSGVTIFEPSESVPATS